MSETVPERSAPSGGGGVKGTFTNKIGPLPMWAWVAVIAAVLVGWRVYASRKSASTTDSTGATADTADVPQFVNQTYTTVTAPVQGPPGPQGRQGTPGKSPKPPGPQQLTRTWTSLGGSTYAEVAQRLLGNSDVANLHPANAAAQKWVAGPYKRNHNAKMPKGLEFTYTEGTVTPKGASVPTVK